jgi:hypothetical protein
MDVIVEEGPHDHDSSLLNRRESVDRPVGRASLRNHLDHHAFERRQRRRRRNGDMEVVVVRPREIYS